MKKGKAFLGLGLAGLLGCSQTARMPQYTIGPVQDTTLQNKQRRGVLHYKGETEEYNITAQEELLDGFCMKRTITLTEKPAGLNNRFGHVDYVRGWDIGCNATIDDAIFRSPYSMTFYLEQYLLYAFEIARMNHQWETRPKKGNGR